MRVIYASAEDLLEAMGLKDIATNMTLFKLTTDEDALEDMMDTVESKLSDDYVIKPFWSEFETILRAVEVEKVTITLILQLIVVVAIFNIFAFIIFISEKKVQAFFLLRALGLSFKSLKVFWAKTLLIIWIASCALSVVFTLFTNMLLKYLPFFQLPGDIYALSQLEIEMDPLNMAYVFSAALVWVFIMSALALLRLRDKSVIHGLRKEFV